MNAVKDAWQADVAELQRLAGVAAKLEESEATVTALQAQQVQFAQRVAQLQGLAKVWGAPVLCWRY
jgi:hypothetical protein